MWNFLSTPCFILQPLGSNHYFQVGHLGLDIKGVCIYTATWTFSLTFLIQIQKDSKRHYTEKTKLLKQRAV